MHSVFNRHIYITLFTSAAWNLKHFVLSLNIGSDCRQMEQRTDDGMADLQVGEKRQWNDKTNNISVFPELLCRVSLFPSAFFRH